MTNAREGEGVALNLLYVIYAGSICRSQPFTPWHVEIRCSYPPFPIELIKQLSPHQCSLTQQYLTQESHIQTPFCFHFLRLYCISSSTIISNPDVHCLGWPFICAQVLTEIRSQLLTACRSHAIRNWKYIPTVPYLLSKKVSYISSTKIASSLFQIPYIFQPAVSNKTCIAAHESV